MTISTAALDQSCGAIRARSHEDWRGLDKRIETVTIAIKALSQVEPQCRRRISV